MPSASVSAIAESIVSYRSFGWATAFALATFGTFAPRAARAQFTTFIPPQTKAADSAKAVVAAAQKATTDSLATMRLTNMKTWVDSAAGVLPPATTSADSAAERLAATTATSATSLTDTSTFANGARAPETASELPLLLLAGGGALVAGLVLIATAPQPRPAVKKTRA